MTDVMDSIKTTLQLLEDEQKARAKSILELKEDMVLLSEQRRFGKVKVDEDLLEAFFDLPYTTMPGKRKNEWLIIVPRFIDFQIGWLEKSSKSYNVFRINKYSAFLDEIPSELKQQLKFEEALPLEINNSVLTTGVTHQEETWEKYRKHFIHRIGKSQIKIKKGYEFKLIAELIKDGCLPFAPAEISKEHLRPFSFDSICPECKTYFAKERINATNSCSNCGEYLEPMELRDYQKTAWKTFLHWGAVGVFWQMKGGKTIIGLYALGRIKGNKLIIVPNNSIRAQWVNWLKHFPILERETKVRTYHVRKSKEWDKLKKEDFSLIVFDEVHYLPAKTFVPLSTLKTTYRMGLSATPFREDGKEHFIFALTGKPIGMDWNILFDLGLVHKPDITIFLCKDKTVKDKKLGELLKDVDIKTMVFCDSLDWGNQLRKKFGIPFISGSTPEKKRLPLMKESQQFVVSRVGDEGISLPDVERIIEYDFLFGSRRQEAQRVGRAHHTEGADYIILVTLKDYDAHEKRFLALYERGYNIRRMRI